MEPTANADAEQAIAEQRPGSLGARRVARSVRFKVSAGVILPLLAILSTYSYLQYSRHRRAILEEVERSAAHTSQVVERTLRHSMLTRDMTRIQQIIDDVGAGRGIEGIFLLNREGEVRFAAGGRSVGTRPAITGPGCRECHDPGSPHVRPSTILTTPEGKRVLRSCIAVRNEAACQACHNPQDRLNGVLITDVSIAAVDRYLATLILTNAGLFVGGLLAAVLAVNLAINRLVVGRLEAFARTIHAFGRGDLSQRVRIGGSDEVHELAEAFNRMADGLEEKARLEEKVQERTVELQRLYGALREKEAERERLLGQVIKAQEEERMRLARELHDELAQALTALSMRLESVERASPQTIPLRHQVEQTRELTLRLLAETRKLILALRPTMLDDLGLVPAIRWYAETHLAPLGVQLDLTTTGPKHRLPPETETALFRIAQEALNNIAKHAQATRVHIRLEFGEGRVSATIQDDGRGFALAEVLEAKDPIRRMGFLGMRERAGLFGGNLRIVSRPGAGTRIEVEVPTGQEEASHGEENPRGDR